jgi:hypothetical protein
MPNAFQAQFNIAFNTIVLTLRLTRALPDKYEWLVDHFNESLLLMALM